MTEKKIRLPVTGLLARVNTVDMQGDTFSIEALQDIAEQLQKKLPLPISRDFDLNLMVGQIFTVRFEDETLLIEGELDPMFVDAGAAFGGIVHVENTEEVKDSRGNRIATEIKKCDVTSLSVTEKPVHPNYHFQPKKPKE